MQLFYEYMDKNNNRNENSNEIDKKVRKHKIYKDRTECFMYREML